METAGISRLILAISYLELRLNLGHRAYAYNTHKILSISIILHNHQKQCPLI